MSTTQRPDADDTIDQTEERPADQPTLAERVMHADERADHDANRATFGRPEGRADQVTDEPVGEPVGSADEPATEDRADEQDGGADRASADASADHDRTATQVLSTDDGEASGYDAVGGPDPADDDPTRVVPAVYDDPAETRPMPAVEPPARSTDRDAARARAEARYRPADDPYESLYAPSGAGGPVEPVAPAPPVAEPEPRVIRRIVRGRPTTDKFHGAFALFVLRLVVAGIAGTHGAQKLLDLGATRQFFAQTQLPYSEWFALATGIGEVLIAGALIIGLLVRVAGLGLVLISVGALVFVQWAPFVLLRADTQGFVGEKELLLAAVGLLFLLLGGGGWGADRMFRSAKSKGQVEEDEA